ncbi:MAG: polysaccharide biosynthesis/export family protein [Longimicrobiales bacterium]|nr:polysaccharide biosynthesis/export family protein [Longimicrobiales bacterium]
MKRILLPLLALLALAPGGASSQVAPAPAPQDANSLLPGDVIRVAIWREEDLSGEFQVDQDGSVILPLLGRRQVVGISPDRLREQLTEEYADYLVNTAVNVTLLRRVVVLGEVRVPGQYTVDATQSVADLIARAQGLTPDGNAEDIRLLRQGESFRTNLSGTLSIVEAGIRSGDQILVGKRPWLSRNFSSLVGVASILANVFVIVSR